ncbi:DNRLRE domain-containing protein [Streptomyces sp. NPDC059467]|uniref:DNRLRE domain-containing protein n=1 Tax=Streptomyces sp. NPDC059467 TaxID=3346844 RepID=UPI0036834067
MATASDDATTTSTVSGEPDRASALAAAEQGGKRVEITGEQAEDSTSWANPDGTLTTEVFNSPIRIKQDGSWTDVDTTLADTGSDVTPGATAADLKFSDGGSGPFAQVADGSLKLGLSVGNNLPEPVLDGNTATYNDAVAGGDLVVTALPTGFSEQVVLEQRPTEPVTIRIPLSTSGGLKVSQDENGHLLLKAPSGATVADAPAPHMWDSTVDDASGLPEHDTKVDSRIEDTADGQVLVLTPDQSFLDSPDTTYPLTIDPTTTLAVTTDTWLETPNYTDSQRSSTELRVGTYDDGTHRARAYLKFDTSAFTGEHIVDTDLSLYSYYSSTCSTSGSGVRVRRVTSDWDPSAISWSALPSVTSAGEVVNTGAHGYNSSCPAAHSHWDIDSIVQAWADGAPNYGLQLRAVDETDPLTWRRYRSANYDGGSSSYAPHLTVTYEDTDLAGIKDSASLSTPVVSSGMVTDSSGAPVTDADVVLYAWPDNDTDAALQEGDSVKLQPVAKAVSDASGNYALRIGDLSTIAPQEDGNGIVNFETVAYSGSTQANFNFPRKLISASTSSTGTAYLAAVTAAGSTIDAFASSDAAAETASADIAPVTATLALSSLSSSTTDSDSADPTRGSDDTPESVTDTPGSADPDDTAADYDEGVTKGCMATLKKNLGPQWVIVGQTYSATTGVEHTLSYSKGASSTLGVGVSAEGTYGSWEASGTNAKSTTLTNDYPSYGNHRGAYYKTEFSYGKYYIQCSNGRYTEHDYYEVRAKGYYGGEKVSRAYIPKATHCAPYLKGGKFTRTTSKAVTWTDGAGLAGAVGVNFSSETGYSTDATVQYSFNANRYICGTGGAPGGSHPYNFVATHTSSGFPG